VRVHQFCHHGQPEKETSFKDEQAQAPKALEIEPAQKAHMAEIVRRWMGGARFATRRIHGGFLFTRSQDS
jgi:hypothetical protein